VHSEQPPGITALLPASEDLDRAVLDLAAVLDGLAPNRFEIVVVGDAACLTELRARAPSLPIRSAIAEAEPRYELVCVEACDGQFDIRELNHLLEAIEGGADVAAGYRPRRTDAIIRCLQRLGWHVDVDCAFTLLKRGVWQRVTAHANAARPRVRCAELSSQARRLGFNVTDVPVSQRRPSIGVAVAPDSRAA
jgi:hypothetical protein